MAVAVPEGDPHSRFAAPESSWRLRSRAAGWHLLISLAVAALAAVLVFGLWYPGAYRELSGGRELFFLITSVDVVLGPLLTFAVFNPAKRRPELVRDLAVIGLLQLGALVYGLHTTYSVRPVALVFEVDRFRVIADTDVRHQELPQAAPEFRQLSLTGPRLIGARRTQEGAERTEALFLGLQGYDTGARPSFWEPYETTRPRALERSRPVGMLRERHAARAAELDAALAEAGLDPATARFLPLMARGDWVVLLTPQGDVAGFAPFDGFF